MLKLTPVVNAPKNKEIKSKDYDKPTFSANVFQPYFRLGIVGSSGTGKTNAWINLFNVIEKDIDKVFIITTSLHNDPKQEAVFLGKENIYVYTEPTIEVFESIIEQIDAINEQHQEYLEFMKVYDKWIENEMSEHALRPKELVLLYKYDFNPKNLNWNKKTRPNVLMYLDDLQSSVLLRHKVFESFVIKARHKNCNISCLTQTFKGITPVWRRNTTGWILFKMYDTSQLRDIYEEIQGLFPKGFDQFLEIYNLATPSKHDFLYIDTQDNEAPLRQNFNKKITLNTEPVSQDNSNIPRDEITSSVVGGRNHLMKPNRKLKRKIIS